MPHRLCGAGLGLALMDLEFLPVLGTAADDAGDAACYARHHDGRTGTQHPATTTGGVSLRKPLIPRDFLLSLPAMPDLTLDLHLEAPSDQAAIDRLHDRAFGPGRFARTAFRLREGVSPYYDLCFTARVGTLLVGSIRLSPIAIGAVPAVLLGPITIDPAFQSKGIGGALMGTSLAAARDKGHRLIMLVGDAPYYQRFGFQVVPPGRLSLPGPVDPGRLLVHELVPGAFEGVSGPVRGARAA